MKHWIMLLTIGGSVAPIHGYDGDRPLHAYYRSLGGCERAVQWWHENLKVAMLDVDLGCARVPDRTEG